MSHMPIPTKSASSARPAPQGYVFYGRPYETQRQAKTRPAVCLTFIKDDCQLYALSYYKSHPLPSPPHGFQYIRPPPSVNTMLFNIIFLLTNFLTVTTTAFDPSKRECGRDALCLKSMIWCENFDCTYPKDVYPASNGAGRAPALVWGRNYELSWEQDDSQTPVSVEWRVWSEPEKDANGEKNSTGQVSAVWIQSKPSSNHPRSQLLVQESLVGICGLSSGQEHATDHTQ